MQCPMNSQCSGLTEPFTTLLTLEWLFLTVDISTNLLFLNSIIFVLTSYNHICYKNSVCFLFINFEIVIVKTATTEHTRV